MLTAIAGSVPQEEHGLCGLVSLSGLFDMVRGGEGARTGVSGVIARMYKHDRKEAARAREMFAAGNFYSVPGGRPACIGSSCGVKFAILFCRLLSVAAGGHDETHC